MTFDGINEALIALQKVRKTNKRKVSFTVLNPNACFAHGCENAQELAVQGIAHFIYLISGMNTNDFIWEFDGLESPQRKQGLVEKVSGTSLRFCGLDSNAYKSIDVHTITALHNYGGNFIDQLDAAMQTLKKRESEQVFISLSSVRKTCNVHSVELILRRQGTRLVLDAFITAGCVSNQKELLCKVFTPFMLLQCLLASAVQVDLGNTSFLLDIANINFNDVRFNKSVIVPSSQDLLSNFCYSTQANGFVYKSNLQSIQDIDRSIYLLIEFTLRLNKRWILRENPFDREGKQRNTMFIDFAEVMRAWKIKQLLLQDVEIKPLYHPQLQYLFNKGAVC